MNGTQIIALLICQIDLLYLLSMMFMYVDEGIFKAKAIKVILIIDN